MADYELENNCGQPGVSMYEWAPNRWRTCPELAEKARAAAAKIAAEGVINYGDLALATGRTVTPAEVYSTPGGVQAAQAALSSFYESGGADSTQSYAAAVKAAAGPKEDRPGPITYPTQDGVMAITLDSRSAAMQAKLGDTARSPSLIGGILGGLGGLLTGGPGGALTGAISGFTGGSGSTTPSCPQGFIKVGGTCVATNPVSYLPGGVPATMPTSGTVVAGGGQPMGGAVRGMAAYAPTVVTRTIRQCPSRYRLAYDNLCYPKAVLGRNSRNRKWPAGRKPLFTGGELKSLAKARGVIKRAERYGLAPKGKTATLAKHKNVGKKRGKR